jgi:hypothetical protein
MQGLQVRVKAGTPKALLERTIDLVLSVLD